MNECPICFGVYTAHRKPLMIPCGHSACKLCLEKFVKGVIMSCPICRREFPGDLSKFQVNYALIREERKVAGNENKEKINELKEDLKKLDEINVKLSRVEEEYQSFINNSESELNSCIESLIHSLEHTKSQIKHKIDHIHDANRRKLNQHKNDIQSSIQIRRRVLKSLMDSQQSNSPLDSSIAIDINVLRDIKPLVFNLQKVEFDHLITLISSNISETLTKNLAVTNVPISLSLNEQQEYPGSVIRTDIREGGSSYANSRNLEQPRWADENSSEEQQHDSETHSQVSNENSRGRRFRGRRARKNNGRRGRHPNRGDHTHNNLDNEEEKRSEVSENQSEEGKEFDDRRSRRPRGNNLGNQRNRRARGRGNLNNVPTHISAGDPWAAEIGDSEVRDRVEEKKIEIPQRPFSRNSDDRSNNNNWSIMTSHGVKKLPGFVCAQINRLQSSQRRINILDRGKLKNIADLDTMQYFHVDDSGQTCHPIHKLYRDS